MNKRQYRKYTRACFGIIIVCGGKLVKQHKYFYKAMHEHYLLKNRIKKYRNRSNIRCFLEECSGCSNIVK